jgi:hypothetical protein
MRRGTQLIVLVAAAGLAGCGGSLARPEGGIDWACLDVPVQPLAGTSCRFAVPPPPECNAHADRAHIGVAVAGSEIPRDSNHVNGWDYMDDTLVTFDVYGPSCDAITASPTTPVSVVFKLLL